MIEVRTRQESVGMGLLLAGVGGYLDAFTYVGYRGVFANAQTGNIVLIGVNIQAGHWQRALLHVPRATQECLGDSQTLEEAPRSAREAVALELDYPKKMARSRSSPAASSTARTLGSP